MIFCIFCFLSTIAVHVADQEAGDANIVEVAFAPVWDDEDSNDDFDDPEVEEQLDELRSIWAVTKQQLDELHSLWDANHDGKANFSEVLQFAKSVNLEMAEKDARSSLKFYDTSHDGKLSLDEALNSERLVNSSQNSELRRSLPKGAVFQVADSDGDGVLNSNEAPAFFAPQISSKTLKFMAKQEISQRDQDGDGKLEESEFAWVQEGDWSNPEELDAVFKRLDEDHDGSLNVSELMRWESGVSRIEDKLAKLFVDIDKDSDGVVNVPELHQASQRSDVQHFVAEWAKLRQMRAREL